MHRTGSQKFRERDQTVTKWQFFSGTSSGQKPIESRVSRVLVSKLGPVKHSKNQQHLFNGPLSIWIHWSKRQWVAVALAGWYVNLHLTPDR